MANEASQTKFMRWHKRLGAYLLAAGLVDEETLTKALEIQRKQSHPKTKLGKLLIEMGMTDDLNIAKTLSDPQGRPFCYFAKPCHQLDDRSGQQKGEKTGRCHGQPSGAVCR
jgi:hypothetical protein